jgi:hypothetical protein
MKGHKNVVQLLLDSQADVTTSSLDGSTALTYGTVLKKKI